VKYKHLVIAILLFIGIVPSSFSQEKSKREPWKPIFNGKDFKGWSIVGSNGSAIVKDSAFECHMVSNTPQHTFVRTNKKYGDFILEADCKLDSGDFNTGFLLRCIDAPDTAKVCIYGYQVKIDPASRKWTGGVFDDYGSSWKWWYTLADDARAREAFKMGYWNHFRMECIGNNIKVWVNDIPTCNLINNKYSKGYIALKIHSMKNFPEKEKTMVRFKNIRVITKCPTKYAREMDIMPRTVE